MRNLPDDWNMYWYSCSIHDLDYHASEGCPVCEMSEEEEKVWLESKESEENDLLDEREFDKNDYEPQDHPEW